MGISFYLSFLDRKYSHCPPVIPSARQRYTVIAPKLGVQAVINNQGKEYAMSSPIVDPILDDINPDHGDASGGQNVIIRGHGLGGSKFVIFGQTKVDAVKPTKISVECVTPEHDEGPVRVYVVLADGSPSNKLTYRFLDYRV